MLMSWKCLEKREMVVPRPVTGTSWSSALRAHWDVVMMGFVRCLAVRVARAEGCCSYPYSCVLCNGAVLQGWAKVAAPPWQHTRLSCASAQVISSVFLFPPLWNWSLSWERRGGWKAGLAGWTHSYKVLHDVPWSSSVSLGVESEQVLDRLGQGYVVRATSQDSGRQGRKTAKRKWSSEVPFAVIADSTISSHGFSFSH